jgi:hypothetical protein
MRPIYKYPEEGREAIRTGQAQQSAIIAAADPMLRDIETRSGMVQGANVLNANLIPDSGLAGQETYLTALRNKLPSYVNSYRAYLEEERKKNSAGSGSGGGMMPLAGYAPTMPPPLSFMPSVGLVPDIGRNTYYTTSPYGAMPAGSIYQLPPTAKTPAAGLARRMATTRSGRMAVE